MSKTITKSKYGICDYCNDDHSGTITFDDEERGWEGYHVAFELCLNCFVKLLSNLEDDKEYNIREIYKVVKEK